MECKDKSMSELFTTKLVVPDYQRPYAWSKQQVTEFFDDLVNFINREEKYNDDFYLYGQIIVHKENGLSNIVDGQQRLATSTIFLCVIRDYIENNEIEAKALLNKINNALGFDDDEEGFRLRLGKPNCAFFYEYVQCNNHTKKPDSKSNILVANAYSILYEKVRNYSESTDGAIADNVKNLANTFLSDFHVSYVETNRLSHAFIIFETLNSRGLELDPQDLLKNHFFSKLADKYPYVKDKWADMIVQVNINGGSVNQYIRYLWNASHELVREKELFTSVSAIKSSNDSKKYFDIITENYNLYLAMINPGESTIHFTEESNTSLQNLSTMGAKSFYPLILALKLNDVNDKEIEKILYKIECMIFRNQTVMKKTANTNEVFFAGLAKDYCDNKISVEDIIDQIENNTISDAELKIGFSTFKPKPLHARMILTNIYNMEHPELKISSSRKVHIEHIMPQTKGNWDVDDITWNEYKDRIGNMILLDGKKNIAASNDLFSDKRPRYAQSSIIDTANISKLETWNKDSIEHRQEEILEKVLKRW